MWTFYRCQPSWQNRQRQHIQLFSFSDFQATKIEEVNASQTPNSTKLLDSVSRQCRMPLELHQTAFRAYFFKTGTFDEPEALP
ncbi:MAG TPA: hypothetical protein DEF45_06930 [Rhodopirellula sp.]|nr:hypothetical protein [Rhodopirellula sp.]